MQQPDSVATKVLNNWRVEFDMENDEWYIAHYVGGEDGVTYEGPYPTKAWAVTAKMKANREARVYKQDIYF